MNYLSLADESPLEKMKGISGPLLVDMFFGKIKDRYVHQLMRSLNQKDLIAVMNLPNIYSDKMFKRIT
jgi:hypothetical protein